MAEIARTLPAVRPVERGTAEVVEASDLLPSADELATIQTIALLATKSEFFAGTDTAEKAAMQIIAGREYGIGPWQSLSGMHIIKGKPTLAADTMAALIQRFLRKHRGGLFRVVESTGERCVIEYRRPEWAESSTVVWTLADAKAAGLLGKAGGWTTYRRAMLRARATSEAARAGFPDICAGLYDPDELDAIEARLVTPADARAAPPPSVVEDDDDWPPPEPEDDDEDAIVLPPEDDGDEEQIDLGMSEDEQRIAVFRDQLEAALTLKSLSDVATEIAAANLPKEAPGRSELADIYTRRLVEFKEQKRAR